MGLQEIGCSRNMEDRFEEAIARWNYKLLEHITEEPQITDTASDINKTDE